MFSLRRVGVQLFQHHRRAGNSFFPPAYRAFSAAELDNRRKKLIYRSGMRGWLELDVLVGNFAARHVPTMTEAQCDLFNEILTMEAPDLYKWLSGQKPVPEELQSNEVLQMMLDYVAKDKSAPYQEKFADMHSERP